ncbi:peptide ABC transporter substrate-binding protein [Roseomonas sp. E05]|uniref:peptide ABC transporter substrate-binding protein n=1 Tax=Roseomonas sp. E05 TaxID=3046310 RepID=UPI0024B89F54|nr:peptide ABC transporter substrate-binding protein [Roseomonas sp. E05]MDJ0389597.1 peptide ABC transporter substrate-binding protein [Roseomonas sp. E05]
MSRNHSPISAAHAPSSGFSRRSLLALSGAGLLAGRTARAQGAAPPPPAAPRGQVVVGLSQEPTVFNPLMASIEVDQGVWWNLFNPLWGVDPEGNLTPQLAREVPSVENGGVSEDGLAWKIVLRDDVVWHDGTPFTAEDVKYTLELINTPGFRARTRQGHELVREITVTGPHEITWRMEKAYAPYLSLLAWTFIVPQHILAKADDPNTAPFNNAPVGTGPFRWGERVPGDHLTLVANEKYFGTGPYLERVVFKYIPDLTALYTQFRTGQIDHTSIQGILANYYAEAKKIRGVRISVNASPQVEAIAPNLAHPALGDKAVRQALYAAINKQAIIDIIYYGLPKPTESFFPKESWAYNPDLPKQSYDPAQANKILDEAGWKRGGRGIREKNGVPLEFAVSTTAGNPLREQVQQVLMQDWQGIGAAMKINNMPAAVIWGEFYTQSKFQSVLVSSTYMTGNDPDCSIRFASWATPAKGGSGSNYYQYANSELDRLLATGVTSFNREARKDAYREVQQIIRDDLVLLPIYQPAPVEGIKEGLIGYQPNVNVSSNCWNIGSWYWAS